MAIEKAAQRSGGEPPGAEEATPRVQRQFTHRGISEHEEAANSNEEQ